MSAFTHGSALQRLERNQENRPPRLRAAKAAADSQENVEPNPKPANRTVLGVLERNHQRKAGVAATNQALPGKPDDYGRGCADKGPARQPTFQVHVDEPDGACVQKRPSVERSSSSPLKATSALCRLPLATLDVRMDVSFDSPMDVDRSVHYEARPAVEVTDYADEIHTHLRDMELKCRPRAGYMKKQPDITNSMRAILVDWLVEVGEEYKLHNETLYLAVNYIDRFLSTMSVLRGKLQLVGTAAMLIASKFEEIYPPEVAEFVYITDDTYTKKQVLRMEHLILKVLSFELSAPTINQFLRRYFLTQPVSKKVENLSRLLGELSLIESDPFLKYLPSHTAAAAFVLANYTVTQGTWDQSLVDLTGYTLEDLMPCVHDLHQMYLSAAKHAQQSIREKYKSAKYSEVSLIEPPEDLCL
ncbi:cyclin-A2 [Denticeps clupeoides]|uniref:Cyclin-A2 n=1 Tax=Denticeps clupeoides TaxID=299321 RepID=A0AAY4BHY4_9TELE|nr:cyclin-A2 [Denticeps clupeoides]